jgi:carbon storage regulator
VAGDAYLYRALNTEAWMLVITRREVESFTVGDEIVITVVEARSGAIRIGIEAPSVIKVQRK